jgi:hypothetical protein
MLDPASEIWEIARMIEPGGVMCVAIVRPLNRPVQALGDYYVEHRVSDLADRRVWR